ncbi:MAG: GLUG motif-containing protein [Collimonas sp.]
MNRIYRSIWNAKTGTFVAVSENAKTVGKNSSSCTTVTESGARLAPKALAISLMMAFGANVYAQPAGGVVTAGGASISSSAGHTTINQSTPNAVISWQSFNIGPGETVRFVQPNSSSVALNRVLGPDPSSILGSLSANGKVFLVNPNGILFGKGAQVNVAGLVASTLDISDSDFMGGSYKFTGAGGGTVRNQGSINADGGYVALLGANVSNEGVISAKLGTVALAAGNAVTLDVAGDGLLNVTVNQGAVNALVQNGGLIQADGGHVLLSAQAAGSLLQSAVNNTGVIQAQTIENHNGTIRLLGNMQNGTVSVGGTLDASAPNGGNGGFIETSAAHVKVQDNARITSAAVQGQTGTWLIDPVDYTIAAATGDITGAQLSANLATSNVTILSSTGAAGVKGDVNVSDAVSWSVNKLTLNAQNNININATMTGSGTASLALQYGQAAVASGNTSTYYVLAPVNLPAGNNFSTTLGSNGVPTNYTVINSLGAQNSITGTDLQGMSGNLAGHYALGSNIDASPTSSWNAGFGFDPVGKVATPFSGNFDGLGHTINNLTIARPLTDNVGLFGYVVSTGGAMLKNVTLAGGSVTGGSYVGTVAGHVTGDIFNSHTTQAVTGNGAPDTYAGGLVGWIKGNLSYNSATGAVTGSGSYVGGLVGWITGNIVCCSATGPVTGSGSYVGGLVGWITGDISRSYASGNVNTAALYVGGLAGWITGNTSNSYATGSVATAGGDVGGLVGWNDGNISNSYSAGAVSGAVPVGGLVGFNNGGTVSNSFWDLTTSGQGLSAGGAGVKGMTTLEMKQQLNFTSGTSANTPLTPAWDFTGIWVMTQNGVTYPSLQSCLAPATWSPVPQNIIVPPKTPPAVVPPMTPPAVVPPMTPPAVVPPVTPPLVVPPVAPPVVVTPVAPATWLPTLVLAETPPELLSVVQPVMPPVALSAVPVETPPVVREETPKIYMAPHRPPKQVRN